MEDIFLKIKKNKDKAGQTEKKNMKTKTGENIYVFRQKQTEKNEKGKLRKQNETTAHSNGSPTDGSTRLITQTLSPLE